MNSLVDLNLLFLLFAFAVSIIVVYTIIFILRKAYFTLSPKETAYFGTLLFVLGFLTSAYLSNDSLLEFAGVIVVFLIVIWFIIRGLYRHHISSGIEASNE